MCSAGAVAFSNSAFGSGIGSIFLDSVACNGTEELLVDCTNNGIGVHNCDHSEDAGARCQLGMPDDYGYIAIACDWFNLPHIFCLCSQCYWFSM